MRLLAVVKNSVSIARYLTTAGELTEVPSRPPGRGPPWKGRVLRQQVLGDESDGGDHGSKRDEQSRERNRKSELHRVTAQSVGVLDRHLVSQTRRPR